MLDRERERERHGGKICKEQWCGIGDLCVFVCERTENFRSFRNLPP